MQVMIFSTPKALLLLRTFPALSQIDSVARHSLMETIRLFESVFLRVLGRLCLDQDVRNRRQDCEFRHIPPQQIFRPSLAKSRGMVPCMYTLKPLFLPTTLSPKACPSSTSRLYDPRLSSPFSGPLSHRLVRDFTIYLS